MKYGLYFCIASILMLICAVTNGGRPWLAIWPAMSFGIVGLGYLWVGPRVFGKRPDGTLTPINVVLLLPFLCYVWTVWHGLRHIKREAAFDELLPGVLIGRRLLDHELPNDVTHVVDLTSEFHEPRRLRSLDGYQSFSTLDATGVSVSRLREIVAFINDADSTVFIHCAEGHGRTGLFAAALILDRKITVTPDEAIVFVRNRRPGVRLNTAQRRQLHRFADEINQPHENTLPPNEDRVSDGL